MTDEIDSLLQQIETVRTSGLPANQRASQIYSIKCRLRKLGWEDQPTVTTQWHCALCSNRLTTHIPMTEVVCNKHKPRRRMHTM